MQIHTTAIVSDKATLGKDVKIGPYSIVHEGVVIGDGTEIGAYCELGLRSTLCNGSALIIGENSIIRSHSVLYLSSRIGKGFTCGHRVTIREHSIIGDGCQIGTLGDIQGDCIIGDYVKLHSNVHVGKHSVINDYVWLFPYVVLTNDPHPPSDVQLGCTIEEFAVVATMSVILPGAQIGRGVVVGAHSIVGGTIPDEHLVVGNPARVIGNVSRIKLKDGDKQSAYPWRRHFHRGYPEDVVAKWKAEFLVIENGDSD